MTTTSAEELLDQIRRWHSKMSKMSWVDIPPGTYETLAKICRGMNSVLKANGQ